MRANDVAPPPVTGPRPGPDTPMGRWPAQLYVGVEKVTTEAAAWDDYETVWDTDAAWDDPATITAEYVDAVCSLMALAFTAGTPDPEGRYEAGELNLTLDNRSGFWSQYDAFGRLVDFLPGRRLAVWAELEGEPWWLWAGFVTGWLETADARVEVTGFDAFTVLNRQLGVWDPGPDGQGVAARLEQICGLIGYTGPRRFDAGDVTLLGPETDRTPLEEMQQTALSDGGVLGVDADGTLLYRDRRWPAGRADQPAIPVLSDNICTAGAVVWDPELATDDDALVTEVALANVAVPPVTVTARNLEAEQLYGPQSLPGPRTEDLWSTALQGRALADFLVARRGTASVRLAAATLYLHDPRQDLWGLGIDLRLGDLIEFLHAFPAADGTRTIDVFLAVQSVAHAVTPDGWTVTVGTTRVVGNRITYRWDSSPFAWDDPAPLNVWGH